MSGYVLWLLLHATTEKEATAEADSLIDEWFRDGTLVDGDKGYVITDDSDDRVICGAIDPEGFMTRLKGEQSDRERLLKVYIGYVDTYMRQAGFQDGLASLDKLPLAETVELPGRYEVEMAGWSLARLGKLINREATPYAGIYNVVSTNAGVTRDEIEEIQKEVSKWALVPVCVG